MGPSTAIAVYMTIWWVVFLGILPFGVTSHADAGINNAYDIRDDDALVRNVDVLRRHHAHERLCLLQRLLHRRQRRLPDGPADEPG